jgi:hypothetical protein
VVSGSISLVALGTRCAATATEETLHQTNTLKGRRYRGILEVTTDLYRWFSANNELLYIGISLSSVHRASEHKKTSQWFPLAARMEITRYATRRQAESAEVRAIMQERPKYNTAFSMRHVPMTPQEIARCRCLHCARIAGQASCRSLLGRLHLQGKKAKPNSKISVHQKIAA